MSNRHIPRQMPRSTLMESGHVCAVCGSEAGVEVHRMTPYAKVQAHDLEDLIALCPNCHHRADRGDIDRLALLEYKRNPYVKSRSPQPILNKPSIHQSISGDGNILIAGVKESTITIKPQARPRSRPQAVTPQQNTIAHYPLLKKRLHERINQLAEYRLRDNLRGDRTQASVRGKAFRDFNCKFGIEQFQFLKVDDFDSALNWVEEKIRRTRYGRNNQKRSRQTEAWQSMCKQAALLAEELGWSSARLSEEIYRTCSVTGMDQVTRKRFPLLLIHLRQRLSQAEALQS